jgi:hypothetical protein
MKTFLAKILAVKNPFVIGTTSLGSIEVAEIIPQEGLKLILQAVIAVATLVKFFKERKKQKENDQN